MNNPTEEQRNHAMALWGAACGGMPEGINEARIRAMAEAIAERDARILPRPWSLGLPSEADLPCLGWSTKWLEPVVLGGLAHLHDITHWMPCPPAPLHGWKASPERGTGAGTPKPRSQTPWHVGQDADDVFCYLYDGNNCNIARELYREDAEFIAALANASSALHVVQWTGDFRGTEEDPREVGWCENCGREVYDNDGSGHRVAPLAERTTEVKP
jgi:hypothetical protein